jgi:RNA polymerase sigma-70 factor (ECF subfamily)
MPGGRPSIVSAVPAGATGDEMIVARLVAGDDSALGIAYERHGGFVYSLARRVTGADDAARDITQDVFTFLWKEPERVDFERGTLRAYLGVVTHRKAVSDVRSTARRREREARVSVAAGRAATEPHVDVVENDARRWRAGRLRDFVLSLPAEQRAALELAYFEGCTYREVAERLAIPEGTAKSRLRLALSRLRTMLEAHPLEAWQ